MKFTGSFVALSAILVASVASLPIKRDVDPALVPDFGFKSGVNPTGTGDCDGAVAGVKIPCACPPERGAFIAALNANVAAGHAVNNPSVALSFPTDNSAASQIARIQASLITLQNLNGPGKGCPAASTTLLAQQKAIQSGGAAPAPAPASNSSPAPAPAAPAAPAPAPASGDKIAQLAPALGFQSGVNPTGTGDCDGAVAGVKIPCACPPAQDVYINALRANVAAGHAVNNPTVNVAFPTDNSAASQVARIQAALVTLQNLNGPGKGCPAASTTLLAQQKAVQAGGSAAPAPASNSSPAPAPAAPAPAAPAPAPASGDKIAQLAPALGFQSGVNPTGTGDCDGAVAGVKIPCACPPAQDVYVNALRANVAAGHAVNNPTINVSFPTDDSNASKIARIQAALVTLQNLNGPGKGCPAASTTLLAQQKALQ